MASVTSWLGACTVSTQASPSSFLESPVSSRKSPSPCPLHLAERESEREGQSPSPQKDWQRRPAVTRISKILLFSLNSPTYPSTTKKINCS
ncbi:hypothetical protein K431DRAFT_127891 [Polychaeton citri CBS 116435]|uniref:Uncharacterized protein n=1 Tax=Polychaeton citri CBS 116435 TaxID=1314669 RepID=A0A9P4Q5L3_9PEZI|nr:hypothetical protein K431DRAFT_127891 [Polychaeton citri CBS 116435]